MARTSITGYQRQYGSNGKSATPSVGLQCIQFTFDATQTAASVSKTLPNGSIPLFSQIIDTTVTGGTTPTVVVGFSGDTDAFMANSPSTAKTGLISAVTVTTGGASLGETLTSDTIIFAGDGTGTQGTGNVTVGVYYIMADDGSA